MTATYCSAPTCGRLIEPHWEPPPTCDHGVAVCDQHAVEDACDDCHTEGGDAS